jgi:hypothetical protein
MGVKPVSSTVERESATSLARDADGGFIAREQHTTVILLLSAVVMAVGIPNCAAACIEGRGKSEDT